MFGASAPTSPGRGNGPAWPEISAPPVSVWPYASQTFTPHACQSVATEGGSGAPLAAARRARQPHLLEQPAEHEPARERRQRDRHEARSAAPAPRERRTAGRHGGAVGGALER